MDARLFLMFVMVLSVTGCVTTGSSGLSGKGRAAEKVRPNVDPKITIAYEMALVSMRAGNTSKAEKQFNKLSSDYPEFSGPHNNLGILYYRDGDIEKAKIAFGNALKINPDSVVSLNYLGIISRGEGEFKQAQGFYEKACRVQKLDLSKDLVMN